MNMLMFAFEDHYSRLFCIQCKFICNKPFLGPAKFSICTEEGIRRVGACQLERCIVSKEDGEEFGSIWKIVNEEEKEKWTEATTLRHTTLTLKEARTKGLSFEIEAHILSSVGEVITKPQKLSISYSVVL